MKRLCCIVLAMILGFSAFAQKQVGAENVLDSLVLNYVASMQAESVETKEAECDFLISSVRDSVLFNRIAVTLFNYYRNAPVMGDEAVAIYLFDKWFVTGKTSFPGEFEGLDAEMFCNMNRNTLLGMDAPQIALRKPCGGKRTLPEKGRTTILWFYDTACSKCKLESRLLPGVLKENLDFPVTLCAVYSGQDRKAWREFRRSFKVDSPYVKVEHYWDPDFDSDHLRLYGVVATPKMYMVAPEGSIIGRRLELDALPQLLPTARRIHEVFTNTIP